MQVVRYDLLCIVLEGQEADVAKDSFECSCSNMRPVQHPIELGPVYHVAFQGGQKDLRCVGEDNDAQRYWEFAHVNAPSDTAPAPLGDLQQAVGHNNRINGQVSHCAPERQH